MSRARASGWPALWQHRHAAVLLLPLAALFALLSSLRRTLYRIGVLRSWRAPVPVIVIGNVTVGGTGKTPLLLLLAQQLRAAGRHPGIVSRGWGRHGHQALGVDTDMDPRRCGDEPLLLRQRSGCPVWVGADRAAAARALLAAHPEVDLLLSDDGLQHRRLQRDLELVLVDSRGPGNGWLLPAGPLRERWRRHRDATLGPADALDHLPGLCFALQRRCGALRHLASGERVELAEFLGRHGQQRLAAAAGIGHPAQFFQMLRDAGCALQQTLPLPDHAALTGDPFASLDADWVLITDKDALKCSAQTPGYARLWAVELTLQADSALVRWVLMRLSTLRDFDGSTPA